MVDIKKYKITIIQLSKQEHEMILEGKSSMDALDQARALVNARNKTVPSGTIYSIDKVEEISNEN